MNPAFDPFKGEGYDVAEMRMLLVGESHYGAPEGDARSFTADVVEDWREQREPMRFFDNVAALLLPDGVSQTGRELDEAAFYNFVQVGMPTAADRPSRDQLVLSAPAFPGVLERLSPTHVLVAGRTQWSYLPAFDYDLGRPTIGGKVIELGVYMTPRGPALATCIPHPSWRFFTPEPWRRVVQEFLKMDPLAAIPGPARPAVIAAAPATPF